MKNPSFQSYIEGLAGYAVGECPRRRRRKVDVCLKSVYAEALCGRDMLEARTNAVMASNIVVVIISRDYFESNMLKHDYSTIHNVLLEWILALECKKLIFPIFEEGYESYADRLPNEIPMVTFHMAHRILREAGVEPSLTLSMKSNESKYESLRDVFSRIVGYPRDVVDFRQSVPISDIVAKVIGSIGHDNVQQ